MAPRTPDGRRRAERHGLVAEYLCAVCLLITGHRIIKRRFKSSVGEVDLIARRGRTLIFVEVKFRRTKSGAAFSISPRQKRRIAAAAAAFLARYPSYSGFDQRIDVFLVSPWSLPTRIKNAW